MLVPFTKKLSMLTGFVREYLSFLSKPYSPILANVDLTMKCNSRCRYCLRWHPEYKLGAFSKKKCPEMSTEDAYAVIDNISKFPVINVSFQGAESLLREDIADVLRYAKKKKLRTQLITNAVLLEQKAEEIAPYLDSILISYDTPYRKDYKFLRGIDALNLVERGIKKIVELSRIHKFLVITNSVITKINAKYIQRIIKAGFERLGVHGMSFEELLVPVGTAWVDLKVKSKHTVEKITNILKKMKEKYPIMNSDYYLNHLRKPIKYLCKPWLFLMVDASGKVGVPCTAFVKKNIDFTKSNAYEKWYGDKKIWDFKCNICTMQCVIETSKLFPVPPPGLFMDWFRNVLKAKARASA